MPKEGKCPGDCPVENEPRVPQPKTVPAKKSTWDITEMWKPTTKQGAQQDSKALADRRYQSERLKGEY